MYNEYFGFSEKPFNVTPNPRFIYLSDAHQEALAAMIYGIKDRRGFVSIVGEVGTGKTTLLRCLFNELDDTTEIILVFNTNVTFLELLKNILWEADITAGTENKTEMVQLLNRFLLDKLASGTNVALIIDEAQNLSQEVLEELRMLSNLETESEKLLQIVLVGQPELTVKLSSPSLRQLKQRIGINCFLTPLSYVDRIKYIKHRLNIVGCKDDQLFSQKALELICEHSKGIPRVINILCDNALLAAFGKDCKKIDRNIVAGAIDDYERSTYPADDPEASSFLPEVTEEEMVSAFASRPGRRNSLRGFLKILAAVLIVCIVISAVVWGEMIYGTLNELTGFAFSKVFKGVPPAGHEKQHSIRNSTNMGLRQSENRARDLSVEAAKNIRQVPILPRGESDEKMTSSESQNKLKQSAAAYSEEQEFFSPEASKDVAIPPATRFIEEKTQAREEIYSKLSEAATDKKKTKSLLRRRGTLSAGLP